MLRGDIPLLLFSSPYHVPHFPLLLLIFFRFFYIAPGHVSPKFGYTPELDWPFTKCYSTCRQKKLRWACFAALLDVASDRSITVGVFFFIW